jgi:hypothetical protein
MDPSPAFIVAKVVYDAYRVVGYEPKDAAPALIGGEREQQMN